MTQKLFHDEEFQRYHDAMMRRLEPLMPNPGEPPAKYGGEALAMLVCFADIVRKCYHVESKDAYPIVQRLWSFAADEFRNAPSKQE